MDGSVLVIPMRRTASPGRYTVEFESVSSDGHRVAGSVDFEIVEANGTPGSPAPSETAASPVADSGDDAPTWPWLLAAGVVGVGAVALLRRISRLTND